MGGQYVVCAIARKPMAVVTHGLASLLAQKVGHLLGVLDPEVAELHELLLALLDGHETEGLVGLGGSLNGIVDILLVGNGDSPELLAGDGVDTVVLGLGVAQLAGDDVLEGVPLDRHCEGDVVVGGGMWDGYCNGEGEEEAS
jgi:hypothetical protein